ncbi:hypothetical protein SS50377_26284 [Spironucleus salmonicida]|uniref:Uncharacterized protein n=1 Tax=Spironucleus salmonicida TaxID=348837 RepID=A0A9P8RX32_9EUKA|nr:hypothetical protein SS50377_26284 [Spironucleus salmonicida]
MARFLQPVLLLNKAPLPYFIDHAPFALSCFTNFIYIGEPLLESNVRDDVLGEIPEPKKLQVLVLYKITFKYILIIKTLLTNLQIQQKNGYFKIFTSKIFIDNEVYIKFSSLNEYYY